MDSEHRHELEENALAKWLAAQYDDLKPRLPAYGLAAVALVAAIFGLNAYRTSSAEAEANRWRDFTIAVEGAQPNLELLQQAVAINPGTPVAEWADVTWADGKLFGAAGVYFQDRAAATTAAEEAVEVYERLTSAKDRDVSERAAFQLARAYELLGKLDEARDQYGRVTGPFAEVSAERAEQLAEGRVREDYAWITATKGTAASASAGAAVGGDIEPDDIAIPEKDPTSEEADAALEGLLGDVSDSDTPEEGAAEGEGDAEGSAPAAEGSAGSEPGGQAEDSADDDDSAESPAVESDAAADKE